MGLIVFGQLRTFGTIRFSGAGAINNVRSAWPTSYEAEYDTGLVNIGQTYPMDTQGLEPAPFKGFPTISYEYVLLAPQGVSEALAFKTVRMQWNTIYQALQSRYTWTQTGGAPVTNVTGQKGTLVVADEDPLLSTTWRATARCMKPGPWQLVKGEPGLLVVQIPFSLLSDFTPSN